MWQRMRYRLVLGFAVFPVLFLWDTWRSNAWAEVSAWEWLLAAVVEVTMLVIIFRSRT
jgi:hypothetical protein